MPDAIYEDPRLAAFYDVLEAERTDLDVYCAAARRLGANTVLDLGCGTGALAIRLAEQGIEVTAVDPAAASLDVARRKPGSESVRWVHGDSRAIPTMHFDLATMTANVAQAITDDREWAFTLQRLHRVLSPSGFLVFETRRPDYRAWLEWNERDSRTVHEIPGTGRVESWVETTDVSGSSVSFRWTYVFAADSEVLTSDSTLRFRELEEVASDLSRAGFTVREVADAPDRPGREMIFHAQA
ncbi:methyltransferase domain-containing protein [Rhodococcus sp. IEGM 1354]|uniref:class I SAM-dependent methyltransferase n=1 Tax=Rhodococcus sp. IEGM 1354 TaxID=3047088 RepID=UPI0024B7C43A|nr:class I SAM-dependent methyltransferase [Rhodococcus sp. IEGM 1354]MDI9930801.1 methyltransferase domain-containing protein [Rhodococcus sp. IEGM 1354]